MKEQEELSEHIANLCEVYGKERVAFVCDMDDKLDEYFEQQMIVVFQFRIFGLSIIKITKNRS